MARWYYLTVDEALDKNVECNFSLYIGVQLHFSIALATERSAFLLHGLMPMTVLCLLLTYFKINNSE